VPAPSLSQRPRGAVLRLGAVLRRYVAGKTLVGLAIIAFFVLMAIVGPHLLTGSPTAPSDAVLLGPSSKHLLGTTVEGQDVLTQLVDGTGSSLEIGFAAGFLATIVAVIVGLWAGYIRGLGGDLFSGLSNVFLVIPTLPLVIVLAGYLPRAGLLPILIVIAVTSWAGGARVLRAQTLAMAERDYVNSARAIGEPTRRILLSELLPNLSSIVMTTFIFAVIGAIATEAGLAFLGLGDVEQVSWGYMINLAQSNDAVFAGAWWWWLPPGACYAIVGAALGLINFGIDEVANPRLQVAKLGKARAKQQTDETPSPAPSADRSREQIADGRARKGFIEPLLEVRDLQVGYETDHGTVVAVQGVTFQLGRGEILGIAGESGSGKSSLAHAITRLIHPPGVMLAGAVLYHRADQAEAVDILGMGRDELRAFRWEQLSIVFQSAMNALNPVMTILVQMVDVIRAHRPEVTRDDAEARAKELLQLVGVPSNRATSFPHELSGGTRQRVIIAMSLALEPELVVLDEPTTGLDVVIQREILDELLALRVKLGFSVIFITHDLSLLLETCDSVMVMYAGQIIEIGMASELHLDPLHPYSRGLRDAFPPLRSDGLRLEGIAGSPPDPANPVGGCAFHPRCDFAFEPCSTVTPDESLVGNRLVRCHLYDQRFISSVKLGSTNGSSGQRSVLSAVSRPQLDPGRGKLRGATALDRTTPAVLKADHLVKRYRLQQQTQRRVVTAVDDVSIEVRRHEVTAIVGESGSGKSTLLRLLALLDPLTSGTIELDGRAVPATKVKRNLAYRSEVQMVFQDPFASLNPARTVGYQLGRALSLHGTGGRREELLERVNLVPAAAFLARFPHELSGGQRQRVAIARALAVQPSVLLADEPVSMLDVSMQVDILNLLDDLRRTSDLGMIYVTHNIASARYIADVVNVMYAGRLVESGPPRSVTEEPAHPYTKLLMRSAPDPDRHAAADLAATATAGVPPDLADAPTGCPFNPRCPFATDRCRNEMPPSFAVDDAHWAKCWLLEREVSPTPVRIPVGASGAA
jgi:peptide/nickel transport system permease protein